MSDSDTSDCDSDDLDEEADLFNLGHQKKGKKGKTGKEKEMTHKSSKERKQEKIASTVKDDSAQSKQKLSSAATAAKPVKKPKAGPVILQKGHGVYVMKLEKSVTEDQLRAYMESIGPVLSVSLVKDKRQVSRGFAFVYFKNDKAAKKCLAAEHAIGDHSFTCKQATQLQPRMKPAPKKVVVVTEEEIEEKKKLKEAAKKLKRKQRLKNKHGKKQNSIFVAGLHLGAAEATLTEYFSTYGKVAKTHLVKDKEGKSRGFGFVVFSNDEEYADAADKAVTAGADRMHMLNGCKVSCKLAERREDMKSGKEDKTENANAPEGPGKQGPQGQQGQQTTTPRHNKKRKTSGSGATPGNKKKAK